MKVLAEGIETAEQVDFLAAHGCDQGQGYFFSAAVPADEAGRFLLPSGGTSSAASPGAS